MTVYGLSITLDDEYPAVADGIYLHGQLEKMNQFDLVYIPKADMPQKEGEFGCEVVVFPTKQHIPAIMFYWTVEEPFRRNSGLIVLPDDTEAIEYAKKKYEIRSTQLSGGAIE